MVKVPTLCPQATSSIRKNRRTEFLLDIGDHLDRSNIYTEATLGLGNVKMLNEAQYDVVTIGNNEGITLAFDDLFICMMMQILM